ncbi:MAG: hypothetical protein ACRDPY_00730 [Streptosporangiaceae bacterium]
MAGPDLSWRVGTDAEAVHALLRASDEHHAALYGLPVPNRRPERTRQLVQTGAVQVLQDGTEIVAMFTLTEGPPYDQELSVFPSARQPLYLQRLAVQPRSLASVPLLGIRCLRRAVQVARSRRADVLRAEANPDLTAQADLLATFGFAQCGPVQSANGLRRVYLQKVLAAQSGTATVAHSSPAPSP